MTWDAAGSPFVAGMLCPNPYLAPGVARFGAAQQRWLPIAGVSFGLPPSGVVATSAQLPAIGGAAFDPAGNLFLVAGNGLYRIDGTTGVVTQVAGGEAGFAGENQAVATALFDSPSALAFGSNGDLYVADTGNNMVRRISGLGASARTAASVEAVSGDGQTALLAATLAAPLHFRVRDAQGHLLPGEQTRLVPGQPGVFARTPLPTDASGEADGMIRLGLPPGMVTVRVYLAGIHEAPAGTPAVFTATAVEPPSGTFFTVTGLEPATMAPAPGIGVAAPGVAGSTRRIHAGSDGTLYTCFQTSVLHLDAQGVFSVVAGNGRYPSQGESGPAVEAAFVPMDLVLDERAGLIHIADETVVRSVDLATGLVSPLAGPGKGQPGDGDGGLALDATFGALRSIELEKDGTIDLGSYDSNSLRRIHPLDGTIRASSGRRRMRRSYRRPWRVRFCPAQGWPRAVGGRLRVPSGKHAEHLRTPGPLRRWDDPDLRRGGLRHRACAGRRPVPGRLFRGPPPRPVQRSGHRRGGAGASQRPALQRVWSGLRPGRSPVDQRRTPQGDLVRTFVLVTMALLAACASPAHPVAPSGSGGAGGTGGDGAPREICDNGVDDDDNGLTDCLDPFCLQNPSCPACGDGSRDPREPCDGSDVGGLTCSTLGFDSGILKCTNACQLDTSSCFHKERCDQPGDEDGNGSADCADPSCATFPSCLKLSVKTVPGAADASSRVHLVLAVQDASGKAVNDARVAVTAPPGAWAGPPTATGADGQAFFDLFLGRITGDETFTAVLLGTSLSTPFTIRVHQPAAGTVVTLVNGLHLSGQDASGPAVGAALGEILDSGRGALGRAVPGRGLPHPPCLP